MTQETYRIGPFELLPLGRGLGKSSFEGVLHLLDIDNDRNVQIFFLGGTPMYCRTDDLVHSFPAYALRHEIVERERLRALLREGDGHGLLEDRLVEEELLSAAEVRKHKTELSGELFDVTMAAPTLDYRVRWTRTRVSEGALRPLDPWESFFRVVLSGENPEFQREYLAVRGMLPLTAKTVMRPMLPRYEQAFGEHGEQVVRLVEQGLAVRDILSEGEDPEILTPALFALLFSGLAECASRREVLIEYRGLARGRPAPRPATKSLNARAPKPTATPAAPEPEPEPEPEAAALAPEAPAAPPAPAAATLLADLLPSEPILPPDIGGGTDVLASRLEREAKAAAIAGIDVTAGATLDLAAAPTGVVRGVTIAAGARGQGDGFGDVDIDDMPSGVFSAGAATGEQKAAASPRRSLPEEGDPSVEGALEETLERLRQASPYSALGVEPEAPFSVVRETHVRLRHKYDDAQYGDFTVGRRGIRFLTEIRAALDRALKVLTDPRARHALNRKLGLPERVSDELRSAFEAEQVFRLGMQQIGERDWSNAVQTFQTAIEKYHKEPSYHAHLAWALFNGHAAGSLNDPDAPAKAQVRLQQALTLAPRLGAVHLLRARIAVDQRDHQTALESYQRVQAALPDNDEAQQELRRLRPLVREARMKEKKAAPQKNLISNLFSLGRKKS